MGYIGRSEIHKDIDTAFAVAGWLSLAAVAMLWLGGWL